MAQLFAIGALHASRCQEETGTAPNCEDTGKMLGAQGSGKETRTYRCGIETEMSSRFATTEFARWIESVGTDQDSAETGGGMLTFERGGGILSTEFPPVMGETARSAELAANQRPCPERFGTGSSLLVSTQS